MNSKYKNLFKDTFIFAIGSLGSKAILFLMVPLYTNYMTDEDYGTADLVFTFSQFIIPCISLVIFDAVIRFGLSRSVKRENALLVSFTIFCCSSVISFLITPLIGLYHTISEWKWYLYIYVIASILNSIEMNYLKAKDKNKIFAALSILQTALMAGLNVGFLVYFNMGVRGYLLAYIVSCIVVDIIAFICGNVFQDLRKAEFDKILFKNMVIYSTPLTLNNVSWWVIHSSDKIMVEVMVSTAALGIYTAAAKIPSLINVFVTVFQQAWGISTVKEIESTNDNHYYSSVFKVYTLLTFTACVFLVGIIKAFMQIYVGEAFRSAWKYVPLLLVSAVFASIAGFYGSLYGALKKSVNNMLTTLLAAVVNIIVNFLFIPCSGIWGAVIGTVSSYIAIAIARMIDVRRFIKINVDYMRLTVNATIILAQSILVSLDYYGELFSVASIILFVVINRKDMIMLLTKKKKGNKNENNIN